MLYGYIGLIVQIDHVLLYVKFEKMIVWWKKKKIPSLEEKKGGQTVSFKSIFDFCQEKIKSQFRMDQLACNFWKFL